MKRILCATCGEKKPESGFTHNKRTLADGTPVLYIAKPCNACRAKRTRAWQRDNKERYYAYLRAWNKRKYWENIEEARKENRERHRKARQKKKAVHK